MYTRRLILAAVLVLAASMLAAQVASAVGMHRGMGPGMTNIAQLTKDLNLTPDQVSKIQGIQQGARAQRQSILADQSLTPDARRAKLVELAKSNHEQMMSVLTPDQQAKYKQLHAQRKAERMNKMSTALGLTPAQQSQIKAIKDKEKADIKAVVANSSLAPDAKVAQIKQIRSTARDQMRALLTPDQRAKLDAMHKNMPRRGAGPKAVQPKALQPTY